MAGGENPESLALKRANVRRLQRLLGGLSARERELLALKYGADATNRDIATLTGLRESNVGTILHRTVAALRAAWGEGGRP
jgi:RNA polymerase sigma-70 factor (ECF subfamily)